MSILRYSYLLILLLTNIGMVNADPGKFHVDLIQHSRLADDGYYQVGNWTGLQLRYDISDVYLFASRETANIIPLWGIGDMHLTGLGAGIKHDFGNGFTFFGQIGYYLIDHENEGRHPITHDGGEGMAYYLGDRYKFTTGGTPPEFDEFMIEYKDTIGTTVGVEYVKSLAKGVNVGLMAGYRSMKISELLRVMKNEWDFDNTGACWEEGITRNYSSFETGLTISFEL